jgi:hypothetical protein
MPMVVKSSRFSDDTLDNAIDSFDLSERDFHIAVVQNAFYMFPYHSHKFFQRLQPLPSQFIFPTIQKFERICSFGIIPQGPENFFEVISGIKAFIQSERFLEQPLLFGGQIEPSAQKEPALAAYQLSFFTTLTEELSASYFIDCIVQVTDQVKFVEDDLGILAESLDTGSKGLPHIHANHLDRPAKSRSCCLEKGIQRNGLMAICNTYNSASFEVADNGVHVIPSTETDFVHTKPSDILHWSTVSVIAFQHGVFNSGSLMPGNAMLFRCCSDRLIHTIFKDHLLETAGKAGSAINEWKSFTANPAAGAVDPTTEKPKKNRPIENRFIAVRTYGSVFDTGYDLTASVTDGRVAIARDYPYNGRHCVLEKLCAHNINRKTIDSNKGIEYFLCSWHLVFLLPFAGERRRSVSNEAECQLFF